MWVRAAMSTFFQFALIGLGAGGAYAICAVGLVQVYRGSGVLNLAQGAFAFLGAILFAHSEEVWHWKALPSGLLAVAAAAAFGVLVQVLVMHPLRSAAVLTRMIATLGVFAIVSEAIPMIFGINIQEATVASFYPSGQVHLGGGVEVPDANLVVVAVTVTLGIQGS